MMPIGNKNLRQFGRKFVKRWLSTQPSAMPRLRFDGAKRGSTIYYVTPDYDVPSGGVRTLYRHVDLLNAEGLSASIVHTRKGFSCTWFPHQTRIAYAEDVCLGPSDLAVVPEVYGETILNAPPGVRQVIFNQNAYLTYLQASFDSRSASAAYIDNPNLVAILVVSSDNAEYMRYAFPKVRVERVHQGIDPQIFYPPQQPPPKRIAFMPRRYGKDIVQVIQLLQARGALRDWELVPIQNSSPAETAEQLRSAAIFLVFSNQEGFGLPPVEAMACGCLVVGFHGHGGREFLQPDRSFPLEQGDVRSFAATLERLMREFETKPAGIQAIARRGTEYVRGVYTPERERSDVVSFFAPLVS